MDGEDPLQEEMATPLVFWPGMFVDNHDQPPMISRTLGTRGPLCDSVALPGTLAGLAVLTVGVHAPTQERPRESFLNAS